MLGVANASGLLCCATAEPRLELGPDGGGDLRRGEIGHCGVVSPEGVTDFGTRPGNFDTASLTAEPFCCRCGTLDADNARWIAAADGCVDKALGTSGGLSWRMGEAFLDVRGLAPGAGDAVNGVRFVDADFLSVGTDDPEDEECVDCLNCVLDDFLDVDLSLVLPAFSFASPLPGSAVSVCPLTERKMPWPSLLAMTLMA